MLKWTYNIEYLSYIYTFLILCFLKILDLACCEVRCGEFHICFDEF